MNRIIHVLVFICPFKCQGTGCYQYQSNYLFVIFPLSVSVGCTGEKDRSALSHEAFLLMANSQNDMEDWVKAIRRVIWAPFGGGSLSHTQIKPKHSIL